MDSTQIFLGTSLFSFLFMIATGAAAFGQTHDFGDSNVVVFFTIITNNSKYKSLMPVVINDVVLYILFVILFVLAILSCVLIFLNRNDSNVSNGLFGPITKFHFVPLLCASCLYIIGESFSFKNFDKDAPYVFSLIFSVIGLGCLIFIYLKTDLSTAPIQVRLIIQKGLYACLMTLFVYNFFFTLGYYVYLEKAQKGYSDISDIDAPKKWIKGSSIAFSIIIGVINLCISFLLKELCVAGTNFLIYLGLTIYFFQINKEGRKEYSGDAEGAIDIIILILSAAEAAFIGYKYREKLTN